MKRLFATLATRKVRDQQRGGYVLWSVIGDLLGYGSTSSAELCVAYGYDPNLRVKKVLP